MKRKLKRIEGKGEDKNYWKASAGFSIMKIKVGRKIYFDLMQYDQTISYFSKLSSAKKIAQLIRNG